MKQKNKNFGDENPVCEQNLLRALIDGVTRAIPEGGSERDVATFVSGPMWDLWCKMTDLSPGTTPTSWRGKSTARIYGSETILIDSDKFFAISCARSSFAREKHH